MGITLKPATKQYLDRIKDSCIITKYVQVKEVEYMRNFFSTPGLTTQAITKNSFTTDGFEKIGRIVEAFVYDMLDSDFIHFLNMSIQQNHFDAISQSYSMTKHFYDKAKAVQSQDNRKMECGEPANLGAILNQSRMYIAHQDNNDNQTVMCVILKWEDKFKEVTQRIIAACNYALTYCVDNDMVDADMAKAKFPHVVDFFNLDEAAAELCLFCYTFRSTNIKLPRDVQNFKDRMVQISQLTKVDLKDITPYATINKKNKQFCPFVIETVSLQDSVWNYMANERAESLEECFYKVLKMDDTLPREFFDTIDKDNSETIVKLIQSSTETKRPRHILLYGKPGTGKTSYMKLLCKLSGRRGYTITQSTAQQSRNNNGMESEYDTSVESRFMSITICDERIDSNKSIIIVDEADEMINCFIGGGFFGFGMGGNSYDTHIKSLLNQVMDNTETPIIWITNNPPSAIDPSCRRRFDYSIFFDDFNEKQRALIWKNNVSRFNLKKMIDNKMIDELAGAYAITPGGIAMACHDLADLKPAKSEVMNTLHKVLDKHCELLQIPTQKSMNEKFKPVANYSLDGLNIESSIPLKEVETICQKYLEKKAKGDVTRSMCILLSGPSGTGKTEFTKYLGSVLKRCVHVVRGSTVLDKYVGETEKHIAAAFKKAEDNDAILFMDEVDGLLSGRDKAHQSWEVSQVNEILQQMENFRGIFIAASNFSENLDSASVRRFAFKFKFDELKDDGIISFYNRYFGKINTKDKFYEKIRNMRMVTPGDFSVVKMLSEYTNDKVDSEWIYNALKRETDAKKSNSGIKDAKPKHLGY